jgi:hypothetical protein
MMSKVIFFINRYNDIDHMSPIIYKLSMEDKYDINVLSINPNIEIFSDFRLKFLADNKKVKLDYFYTFNKNISLTYIFGSLICINKASFINNSSSIWDFLLNSTLWFVSKSTSFLLFKLMRVDVGILIKKIYDKKWVQEFFTYHKPSILIFDAVTSPRIYNIEAVLSVAKKMHISTVDVPHGIPLYTSHPEQFDVAKKNLVKYKKNHMIMNHKWWKNELLNAGLNPKNTPILGNARFCNEWVEILDNIIPCDNSLKEMGKGKLKVAYMEMGNVHDVDIEMVREVMLKVSLLDFLTLVVKPQTRNNTIRHEFSDHVYVATNENSVNLIKWADVVIVIISSIMVEALVRDKCAIYLKFTHKGEMLFDKYNACWAVESYEELEGALKNLYKNREYCPYLAKDKDLFLNEVIFNKFEQEVILDSYVDYLNDILENNI